MPVELVDVNGSVLVGAFCFVNQAFAIIPPDAPKRLEDVLTENLGVRVIRSNVADSPLIGILVAGNDHGLLLPRTTLLEEFELIKREAEIPVYILNSKKTALGNLILANSRAALIHPDLADAEVKEVEDALDVEVARGSIAKIPFVGSTALLNDRGLLVHPSTGDDELRWLEEFFKVRAEGGTVNHGSPLLRVGAVVNNRGALAGLLTTGLEIAKIERVLLSS
ncbi:MAG: translation initiation factor IF-6 [Candidatus Nezhaarchaeota archaeon]|nr:translation initiation factor IF-6 [Candidatus Nezhaarchaeota archaeon]